MLVIRRQQMDALRRELTRSFVAQLCNDVREHFPDRVPGDPSALRPQIEALIDTAAGYGITAERDVSMFVFLAQQFGEGFARLPWASSILEDQRLTGAEKAARLYERGQLLIDLAPAES